MIRILLLISLILNGCHSTIEKLKNVGKPPEFSQIRIPVHNTEDSESKLSNPVPTNVKKTNSLWPSESTTTFFRDNRAWRVGDIVKVVVQIRDRAQLNNSTERNRDSNNNISFPSLLGKEQVIAKLLSKYGKSNPWVKTSNKSQHDGSGNISRKEDVKTEVAAVVTQILHNGNLVIQGHQEVRVNYELREIKLAGIIRPQDIRADNSVNSDQIAEARVSYGGRGIISDVQQPKAGYQVIDILSPF